LRVVLLCVSEERVELDTLGEVLYSFKASDVFEELEVSEHIDARSDDFLPVDALQSNVGVVLLEREVESLEEVDVWSLHSVDCPFVCHLELVLVEVLGEDFHLDIIIIQ